MARYQIDLNFYGPYGDVKEFRSGVREYDGETRLLYMAIVEGCNPENCNVAYVGVTQQAQPYRRFYNHHKLGGMTAIKELWAGYFFREAGPEAQGRSLDARLRAAEDVMIAWFVPPGNDAGIRRDQDGDIGLGALVSCSIDFHWYTRQARERRACPVRGFPSNLHFSVAKGEITATS